MKNVASEHAVDEVAGQFFVVDRFAWEQDKPEALLSTVGGSRKVAGPFESRDEAEAWIGDHAASD
jgi:hypothetical protein